MRMLSRCSERYDRGNSKMLAGSKQFDALSRRLAVQAKLLSLFVLAIVIAGILLDTQLHFISQLPLRTVKGIGKAMGEGALNAALLALAYYVVREAYVVGRKRDILDSQGAGKYVVSGVALLRSIHPLVGALAIGLALLHTYILLFVWTGYIGSTTINGGLFALAAIVFVAGMGGVVRLAPARIGARLAHRYGAALFIAAYVFHKITLR